MPDIVGITVQHRSVRGIETRIGRGGRAIVVRTGEVELPEGVFDAGELIDTSAFARCLEQLWDQGGFRTKHARIVIDGRMAVIRRTELPSLGGAQLRQAAGYDIGELLNFPIDQAVFDVDEIERFDRNGTIWAKALVVAVKESALSDLKTAITSAGLRLAGTDLAAEALARGIQFADADESANGPVAIIDCEDSSTNIVIRDVSGVLFARTLNVGVGETTISVADELESALAQLSGSDESPPDAVGSSTAGVSNVVEGIRRTLRYYEAELDDRKLERVIVAGARGQAAGLLTSLEDSLGLAAEAAASVAKWPNDIQIHGYETPIGAALGARPSKHRHLVLTSDRERAQRDRRRRRTATAVSAIPVLILLAVQSMGLWVEVSDARSQTVLAEEATQTLALRRSGLDATEARVAQFQTAAGTIRGIESQQLRLDLVVRELAASMPFDTQLLSIQLQRGVVSDLPPGYVGPTPPGLISVNGTADDLDAVSRWLAEAEASQTLAGVWLQRSTFGPIGADGSLGTVFSAEAVITNGAAPVESLIETDLDGGDR